MRRIISVSILIALIVLPANGAVADEEAVRSGTIVTGSVSGLGGGYPRGCEMTADCRAWLASGCDPALAGRDPALETSIEDVADLAQPSTLWIFEHAPGAAAYATVEFWQQDCTEIGKKWPEDGSVFFGIPASARWMTVTGYTYNPWAVWPPLPNASGPLTFDWTLTGYQRGESPPDSPSPDESPEPIPSPASESDGEERSVALALRGHLRAVGEVVSDEDACRVGVPVLIQRRGSTGWIEVGSTTTGDGGVFAVRLEDRTGRYRAVAPEVTPEGQLCLASASTVRRHRHP